MSAPFDYGLWHGHLPTPDYLEQLAAAGPLVDAQGARVRDASGRWYLDARSSLWNVTLGYSNDHVKDAIKRQLDALPFATVVTYERPSSVALEYADALVARLGGRFTKVRFGSTGAQAVEGAVLLSRFLRLVAGENERTAVVCLRNAYHGFGGLASVLTGAEELYGPLTPDIHRVDPPYCLRCPWSLSYPSCEVRCQAAVEELIGDVGVDRVTAVIVEPVLGTLGLVPVPEYFPRLERFCRDAGIHLILDETSTGFGRVGALTQASRIGVEPDMVILGKGITSGYVPLSAYAVSEDLYQVLVKTGVRQPFVHGSTADGHPLAMAAGLAVLDVFDRDGVLDNAVARGESLRDRLTALREHQPAIAEVRGAGLLLAVELADPDGTPWSYARIAALRLACEAQGVLISPGINSVLIVPPLIVDEDDCAQIVTALDAALTQVAAGSTAASGPKE